MPRMKILFITSSRIGDAVLSTGILNYIAKNYPKASVTISCGPLVVSLFEGYPQLERIIPLKKQKYNKHWIELWRECAFTPWDIVIDIRNSAVSRLVFGRRKFIFGGHVDKKSHKVEQMAQVLKLSDVPAPKPKLWFSEEQKKRAAELVPKGSGKVIGVGPAANWIGKTWPAERFITVMRALLESDKWQGASVAVFAAPGEEDVAYPVFNAMPEGRRHDVIAKGNPGFAAAAIGQCDFYLGNDSGLMHCAAAIGLPTLGLFGPSYPHIYAPWGEHTFFVRTPETFDELIDYSGYTPQTAPCLMTSLSTETVLEALKEKQWI